MKTIIITFILMAALSFSSAGQDAELTNDDKGRWFTTEVAESVMGYVDESGSTDDHSHRFIGMPEYITFDLVRVSISGITSKYSDINVASGWERDDDSYETIIDFDDMLVLVSFYPSSGTLLLIWER